jgi:hypothetical protein
VVVIALLLLAVGSYVYRGLSRTGSAEFRVRGLSFQRPVGFLPPTPVPRATSALAFANELGPPLADAGPPVDAGPDQSKGKRGDKSVPGTDAGPPPPPAIPLPTTTDTGYHVVYQAPADPLLRLEVRIEDQPLYNNLIGALGVYRSGRYGDTYWAADSRITNIGGRDWTRTKFSYAYRAGFHASPLVAHAVEYASLNSGLIYVVTFHGSPEQASELAERVAPTLSVRTAAPPNQPQ